MENEFHELRSKFAFIRHSYEAVVLCEWLIFVVCYFPKQTDTDPHGNETHIHTECKTMMTKNRKKMRKIRNILP